MKISSEGLDSEAVRRRALEFVQANRPGDALALYAELSRSYPDDAEVWFMLGALHGQLGHLDEVITCCQKAIRLRPDYADAYYNLAQAFMHLGQRENAISGYREVVRLQPNHAEAHNNLGSALQSLLRVGEAIECFKQAIVARPDFAEAYFNLGFLLHVQNQQDHAIACYRKALSLRPDYRESMLGIGNALADLEKNEEALACFEKAVSIHPKSHEAHFYLAAVLKKLDRLCEAERHLQEALRLKPDYVVAQSDLGGVWLATGQLDRAEAAYRKALQMNPDAIKTLTGLAFALNYTDAQHPGSVLLAHRECGKCHAQGLRDHARHENTPELERRLRVGYVSPDFFAQSVAFFLYPLLAHHDLATVEVICYASVARTDDFTARFRALPHAWRNIYALSDDQVADLIRQDGIDILVDLAGHTAGNRLLVFARKPAPVQVTYLGYPNTTGLSAIDYRLTDALADPPGTTEPWHTEKLVRLPHGFLCYEPPPANKIVSVTRPPSEEAGHITFGSFNNLSKITPPVVKCWAEILRAVPGARLVIKNRALNDPGVRERYHDAFAQHGIARERLELTGWIPTLGEHLPWYNRLDLALDTFPYNGTTTTCEALWMGVPVITLAGRTHAGRVGISLLTQVGLPKLIAENEDDYVQRAITLANDRQRLAELRGSLRQRVQVSPLCDGPSFARDVETAYREMWRGWCEQSTHRGL